MRGICWTTFQQLEDLDYADDIVVLSSNYKQMQAKINDLNEFSQQANMKINVSKTVSDMDIIKRDII
jgi:hypothetical protein